MKPTNLQNLETSLGWKFEKQELLKEALTHSSYSNECAKAGQFVPNNERLEFLGDAVLGLLVAELLMERFPDSDEGELSRWRSFLVSRKNLSDVCLRLGFDGFLQLGQGEAATGGRKKSSILAGLFEAIFGAFYLDSDLKKVKDFVREIFEKDFQEGSFIKMQNLDSKTLLQEYSQAQLGATPEYRMVEAWGPDHERQFKVEVVLPLATPVVGEGKSKKEAEQDAARKALNQLKAEDGNL